MVVAPRIDRVPTKTEMALLARGLPTDTQVQDQIIAAFEAWLLTQLVNLRKDVMGRIMQDILIGNVKPPPLANELKALGYKAEPKGIWDEETFWQTVSGNWENPFEETILGGVEITASYQASRFYFFVDMAQVNYGVRDWTRDTYIPDLIKLDGDESIIRATRDGIRETLIRWMDGDLGDQGLPDLTRALERWFNAGRARRIAVTEATRIYSFGNREAWKNSYRDRHFSQPTGIEAMRWQTARDDLVCPICKPLNGKQVLLDHGFPVDGGIPPAHPNCRCWLTPIRNYNPRMAPRR